MFANKQFGAPNRILCRQIVCKSSDMPGTEVKPTANTRIDNELRVTSLLFQQFNAFYNRSQPLMVIGLAWYRIHGAVI